MKWLQNGNLTKLVAFFVIATVITCTVSFAANGWQSFIKEPDSDNIVADKNTENDDFDENKDGTNTGNGGNSGNDIPVVAPTPKYYHYLTGIETDLESSLRKPMCIVFSSTDPLYGLSSSYLTIELPTEYGNTRFLSFTDDAKTLGKVGSLAPSRGYINNLAAYFGGVLLSYGNDDRFDYDSTLPGGHLDFSAIPGYCYTEYNNFVYTNGDLVNAFLNNSNIGLITNETVKAPYQFASDENPVVGSESASNVIISFSDGNTTELVFSSTDGKYTMTKNATPKNDLLNDKPISYDNVFILNADSTTYETSESTQLIIDTKSGGSGKYISGGKMAEISWTKDSSGNLVFLNASGERLTINRGTSYIAFTKSSSPSSVKVS